MDHGSSKGEIAGRRNVSAGRRPPSAADQAAEWLATLTDTACTDEERCGFVTWLRRSNLHVEEFLRLSTLARRLSVPHGLPSTDITELVQRARADLAGVVSIADIAPRAGDASARVGSPPTQAQLHLPGARRAPTRRRLAACACALAVLALLLSRYDLVGVRTPTYSTSLGELRSITLEDGSIVELNTQSTLRTGFTPTERRVDLLRGEAVFKVARNRARPFRVVAGNAQIVAVGTAFNVYAQSARTVVTVLEGHVRVRGPSVRHETSRNPAHTEQELELTRGEQAVIAPHTPIAKATLADPRRVTSWTQRRLMFDETPLAEAAAEFARYNSQLIRIEGAALGELHISGIFDATDPASLVQFVAAYGGVAVRAGPYGWTISRDVDGTAGIVEPARAAAVH